jgi:hypothetical protein
MIAFLMQHLATPKLQNGSQYPAALVSWDLTCAGG